MKKWLRFSVKWVQPYWAWLHSSPPPLQASDFELFFGELAAPEARLDFDADECFAKVFALEFNPLNSSEFSWNLLWCRNLLPGFTLLWIRRCGLRFTTMCSNNSLWISSREPSIAGTLTIGRIGRRMDLESTTDLRTEDSRSSNAQHWNAENID